MKKFKILVLMITVFLLVGLLAGCSGQEASQSDQEGGAKGTITVGSKEFTEQLVFGQMTLLALEDAGYQVVDNTGLQGSNVVRGALESGEIDIYWEYTGTAWISYLQNDEPLTDPQECFDAVKAADAENGLVWLDYAPLNNTYTVMMQQEKADALAIKSISDLAAHLNQADHEKIVFATDHEFSIRDDGLVGVYEKYGFEFDEVATMDPGITYDALKNGEVQAAMGFATDGRIKSFNLVNLEDDKQFFPVYNAAPVVRQDVLDKYPDIADILAPLAEKLDDATMSNLNYLVDSEHQEPRAVAETWLKDNGFIK